MASPEKSSPEKDAPLHRRISEKLITTLGIKKTASSEPQQLVEEPVPLEDNEGKSQHDRRFEEKRHSQSGVWPASLTACAHAGMPNLANPVYARRCPCCVFLLPFQARRMLQPHLLMSVWDSPRFACRAVGAAISAEGTVGEKSAFDCTLHFPFAKPPFAGVRLPLPRVCLVTAGAHSSRTHLFNRDTERGTHVGGRATRPGGGC